MKTLIIYKRSGIIVGETRILFKSQGRARPSLAALYNWRYDGLGDLPNVKVNQP